MMMTVKQRAFADRHPLPVAERPTMTEHPAAELRRRIIAERGALSPKLAEFLDHMESLPPDRGWKAIEMIASNGKMRPRP